MGVSYCGRTYWGFGEMDTNLLRQTQQVGTSDIRIPPLCFGTSGLGDMPETYTYAVSEQRGVDTVKAILNSATPFLDSSRNYGLGRSEERVGLAIRELGGLPSGAIISTKLDRDMDTLKFDAARARRSLEESLKALQIDHVQLLHLHDPEHAASVDEITGDGGALSELFKMKEEGLCDAVGLAAGNVDIMMPILRDWDFDVLITHNRHTLVNANAEPLLELATERNVTVLNAAPYCGGTLAKGSATFKRYVYQEASESDLQPVANIEAICAKHDIPPGAAALQFSLRDPRIASTVCGVSKPERVQQTLEWAEWPIPDAAWAELLEQPRSADDPEASRVYSPG